MTHTIGFIYAHPDDETFLSACLIRQLADQGHKTVLLLATKGDAGKKNGDVGHLSNAELAAVRELEMKKAADIMGITHTEYLNYPDGKLNTIDSTEFVDNVVLFINKHQPSVIFTFPEDGGNGHLDHMAISDITSKAVWSERCDSVQKLYYVATNPLLEQGHFPSLFIDTASQWEMKAQALRAHDSQKLAINRYFGDLAVLPENRRYEAFVLGWERGVFWPKKTEQSILDDLI
ncbi:PIG-L family deacetylase [Paenibacillus psychroresistens]|uniref:PIG-L family deacetylase n=1 Tax=Paenibacillus psychroresistens TaxID=1778678 RepID=A0A6B8RRV9_9BACL|nr:PIG-L deacetylase family protein [Paenibacillus psychroresistens]QGQ98285.1 PIG-L family deacetylase [Paenibacillus psychroresistens]